MTTYGILTPEMENIVNDTDTESASESGFEMPRPLVREVGVWITQIVNASGITGVDVGELEHELERRAAFQQGAIYLQPGQSIEGVVHMLACRREVSVRNERLYAARLSQATDDDAANTVSSDIVDKFIAWYQRSR